MNVQTISITEEALSSSSSSITSKTSKNVSIGTSIFKVIKPSYNRGNSKDINAAKELERASDAHKKPKRNTSILQRLMSSKRTQHNPARASTRRNIFKSISRKLKAITEAPSKRQLLLSKKSTKNIPSSRSRPRSFIPRPRAVICGGGPAGATAAMFLARNGYEVDVYENRGEPNSANINSQRAYIIALTDRGLAALEDLDINIPQHSQSGQHNHGHIAIHSKLGTLSTSCEERSVCFTRAGLAQMLIDQAREKYPELIRFHFNHGCEGVDVSNKTFRFKQRHVDDTSSADNDSTIEVSYDILIGADGVNSVVRSSLQQALPDQLQVNIEDSGREYKSFHSLPAAGLQGADGKECSTLHLWPGSDPASMISAHTAGDGTFSGTLSLRTGEFATLQSITDIEALLRNRFPKLPAQWIQPMAEQAAASGRANTVGRRVTCSQMHGPGIVLLGDAAHAVTPVFGQGANSALESCLVLGRALEQVNGNVDALPEAFNELRMPDIHALGELDSKAHSLFWRGSVFDAAFMQVAVHLLFGGLMTMVSGGRKPNLLQIGGTVPYRRLHREMMKDAQWASTLTGAVSFATMMIAFGHTITIG